MPIVNHQLYLSTTVRIVKAIYTVETQVRGNQLQNRVYYKCEVTKTSILKSFKVVVLDRVGTGKQMFRFHADNLYDLLRDQEVYKHEKEKRTKVK
jgi:hypothetical protein